MIADLPLPILILTLAGALIGAFVNWAIYSWTYFLKRPFSPWMTTAESASRRNWTDRIPIAGWILLRRDAAAFGNGFWIRPMLIEIAWAIGLPWFYFWQIGGGLTGGPITPLPPTWGLWSETWFYAHTILIALMCIATFIDFDERTIPDYITIPGTLIGLAFAAGCPWFRLPVVTQNLAGQTVESLHFNSPNELPVWHVGDVGLWVAVAVFTIWILAPLPKICTLRYGVGRSLQLLVASVTRPRRKSNCEFRTQQRRPFGISLALGILWLVGLVSLVAAKRWLPIANWHSLFGSIYGMAFGGGMIWAIRIVARYALQKEAMGFGDVTLMAMIGAFLGWQATLLTFAMAPFAALLIVLVSFIFTRDNELAFGPYLCFGCLVLLLGWNSIWPAAMMQFQFVGPYMLPLMFGMLLLMAILLFCIQWIKGLFLGEEFEA